MKRFVVLTAAIFLLGLSQQAWTQTLSPFEEEAPTTLFQADLADENVDLLIEGFWDSSLSWSTTWAFGPDGLYDSPLSFPGMEPGIIFKQVPDLVLSLWYMDRYFFETTITEDYEYNSSEGDSSWGNERDNTYVLGYMGREGELVRWVRIGNVGIGISPHRFLRIPDSHTSSPGAAARFETADSYHEFMVRFDPTDRETRTYRGTGEVNDERLDLGAFERGRYFILPDDEVENLSVYIQDDEGSVTGGDGRKYRRAVADDAVIDPDRGTVFLKKKAPGRVLVYYTKGGAAVGDGTLGGGALAGVSGGKLDPEAATVDFDWWVTYLGIDFLADRQVTVDGDDCLTIYEPGGFNPFQLTNRYRPEGALAADSASNRLALVERGETDPYRKDEFFFRPLSDEGVFEVYQAGTDIRDPKNRFPFAGSVDSLDYPFLYQPGLLRQTVGEEILVRTVTPADSFAIPSSAIPGSVRILRNGVEETRYEVDYDSGRITFFPYIHPADEIEISYSLPTSGDTGGDVLAATGHEFRFSENLSADLAAALRWNLEPGSFSERPGQHPGTLTASGGLSYAEEDLQASFDLGVSYSSPDTTGYLRLFGMEGAGYSVEIGSENIFPASVPSGASFGTLTPAAAPSFSNRGRLIYKNYYRYDAFGGAVLQDYTWDPPEDQVYPYTSGSKPGPYAADTGSSSIDGNAMVLDFEMDSGQDWVGAQIPVARGSEPLDLSQMEAIQFSWLTEGISDNVEIYLQVGAASEDLDGDGVLDHEYSPYNRGYRFNDPANGANLLIGGGPRGNGNGRIDSEDIDSNSLLDPENGDRIYNPGSALLDMNVGGDTPPTSWSQENLPLAGSRSELTEARFVRIIVVRDGAAGDISGKVVVSPFRFRGAELSLSAEAGTEADEQNILDAVSVREVPETFSADPAPQKLSEAYPEVADIFHSGGAIQRVTEAKWSTVGSAAPGSFTLTGYTPSVPLRYYNSLTFYYRTPGLVSPGDKQLAIDYTDASGRGVHASFPPGVHEAWQRVVVDFSDRTVQVDGQEIAGASVEIDGRVENLNRFKATLSDDDGDSTGNFDAGALYIDEVSLTDPAGLVGTGAAAEVDYRIPGEIWTAGDVPILANLRLRESAYGATRGFSSEYGEPSATGRGTSSTSAGADILYTSLDVDLDISADEYDSSLAGGHRIQIPSFQSPITLTDSYRTDQEGRSLSRSNSLTLRHSDIGQAELDTQSEIIDGTLSQNWNLSADSLWEASPALKLSLSIGKSQTGDYHEDGNYFSRWATGFRFLLPSREGSFLERTGSTDLSLSVPPEPVGLETRAELSYTSSRYTGRLQKNSGLFETTLPLSFSGPPSWGLDFGYSREFDFSRSFSGAGDYAEDFSVLGDDLASHSYIFLSIPYAELFLEKPADELAVASEGYETARYRPESFIRYTRNYGSRLIDLMIPSYAYLSAYREIEREASLIEERFGWSANIRNAAVNLFGRLGAYPFFDFYRTDEFGTGFGFTSDYLKSTGDQTYQLETDQFVYLEFTPGIYFRLEHALTTTLGEEIFEDSSSASFVWEIVPEKPWDLPLLSERIEKETVLSNTERFSLVFEQQGEDDRAPTIQLDLGHETALHFGEYGYIGARIELGWQRRPEPAVDGIDYYHLIGFLAAIEAHLTF